ncbi:MAG: hypothetical protein MUF49_04665 [Oculatellaceae cyanobacterium Prado106]|jgi:hypothetical protein|nr:hypothetical protein [Oculatellaceae cyanobacterium Prado106]
MQALKSQFSSAFRQNQGTLNAPIAKSNPPLATSRRLSNRYGARSSLTPTTVSLSDAIYRVNEGVGNATITVTRSGNTSGSTTVSYLTGGNTAKSGQDYIGVSRSTLTFNPGETSKAITIPILQDSNFETAEIFRIAIRNPTNGAVLNRKDALVRINNDDRPIESQLQGRAASRLTVGTTTIYTGFNQVATGSDIGNKDPWVASFTNGQLNWYRDDYEVTADDGMATHLLWNGGDRFYVSFTATGTQGQPSEDYRRFATNGWLKSYTDGSPNGGGGGRVAVLARLETSTGNITNASFLTALNGRKTNSVFVRNLSFSGSNLRVQADSAFAPRKIDKTAMVSNGQPTVSPNYTVDFAADLSRVVRATAVGYQ